jgi:meso-butanediol dehydrogenase/(S,S)-butanediol dehydrogenase/diacetyl reductase
VAIELQRGLVVAITGAGQGIGLGLAQAFARQGARLVLSDIDGTKMAAAAKQLQADTTVCSLAVDVRQAADVKAQVDLAVEQFGRLDVMVCNAGISQIKPILSLDASDWQRMMDVNVTGTFLTMQAAARQMLTQEPLAPDRPRGKIITLGSIAGRPGAGPIASVIAPYRASKAAVISMTQSAAYTLAPNITVNAMCPGLVETDMWQQMDKDWTHLQGLPQGEAWKQRVSAIPMKRPQTPQDVANLALYLASEEADYVTGQSINIDGGLMMN